MTKQTRKLESIRKRQYWQTEVSAWQQSGMSQARFCRSRELKVKTFSYWHRKFRKEKTGVVQFVQLPAEKLFAGKNETNRSTELKLIIENRFVIEVRDGFNPGTLRQVIETIRPM